MVAKEEPPDLVPGRVLDNRFAITHVIARGNHSLVFEARNMITQKRVALKWPTRPTSFESICDEAAAAGRVAHPNVLDIHDVHLDGMTYFLTMERVHGAALHTRWAETMLNFSTFLEIFLELLEAVIALHNNNVAHCDIKPANVLVVAAAHGGKRFYPKLIDFGSAKMLDAPRRSGRSGRTSGSVPYMSPEQQRGQQDTDHRTDIYSLGVMLRQRVQRSASELTKQAAFILTQVVDTATKHDPRHRFERGEDLWLALLPLRGLVSGNPHAGCTPCLDMTSVKGARATP